jgi:predicted nuclease of predicted toxin-antitoxin system
MRLYLDEDLSPRIAAALRAAGVDARSAHEEGNVQLSDEMQLSHAAAGGRALVTRNARHFVRLAREAIRRQRPHCGIVLCSPRFTGASVRQLTRALRALARDHPGGLSPYGVVYL